MEEDSRKIENFNKNMLQQVSYHYDKLVEINHQRYNENRKRNKRIWGRGRISIIFTRNVKNHGVQLYLFQRMGHYSNYRRNSTKKNPFGIYYSIVGYSSR